MLRHPPDLNAWSSPASVDTVSTKAGKLQLMTDVLMPKMGGIELAERLAKLRPQLEVLYTSGYNDSGSSLTGIPGSRYLQKPCAMEDLAHTLRELLDSAHPPATRSQEK